MYSAKFIILYVLATFSNGQKEASPNIKNVLDVRLNLTEAVFDQYNSITKINGTQPAIINQSIGATVSGKVYPTFQPEKNVDSEHDSKRKNPVIPIIVTHPPVEKENPFRILNNHQKHELRNISLDASEKSTDSHLYPCEQHSYCTSPNKLSEITMNNRCSCHSNCTLFGNCCYDTPLVWSSPSTIPQWSCADVPIKNEEHSSSYYMLSSCPDNWEDDEIRSQCENNALYKKDNYLKIPVTSSNGKITYKNIFCSVCNGDLDTISWNTEFDCRTFSRELVTDLANVTKLKKCAFRVVIPLHISNNSLIRCNRDLISSCPSGWDDYESSYNCTAYLSPVVAQRFRKYKNRFCGLCNGAEFETLKCFRKMPAHLPPLRFNPSFSLLLDANFGRGNIVGSKIEQCEKNQAYDPWKKQCRNIYCGKLFKMQDGKCVAKSNETLKSLESNFRNSDFSILTSDCPKLKIEEFKFGINKTVIVNETGAVFQWGEYEYVNFTSILICEPGKIRYIKKFGQTHTLMTYIGLSISITALLIKVAIYLTKRESHTLPASVIFVLSLTLLLAQAIFLFGIDQEKKTKYCICIGVLIHFLFLASFSWMTILAYDIWKTISSKKIAKTSHLKLRFFYYHITGWMIPICIVSTAMSINWLTQFKDIQPKYGLAVCWISQRLALLIFFIIPLAVHLFINILFFFFTTLHIAKTTKITKMAFENTGRKDKTRFILYVKLAFIMGLTWIFGFIATYTESDIVWYLFIFFNSIQGLYILLAFTKIKIICKGQTLNSLSTTMSKV